jgi:hypothetical protein
MAVSSHMTIRTREVAALFERAKLHRQRFLCTSTGAPLWRIRRSAACPQTRQKLFATDIFAT